MISTSLLIPVENLRIDLLKTTTNLSKSLSTYLIENKIYPRSKTLINKKEKISLNNKSCPLFITMADKFYLPSVRNFQLHLKNYGLENNLIVICLDHECIQICKSKNLLAWPGRVNTSVARIKFDAVVDLSQSGFDFIMFDSDVFLSPMHHPLSSMSNFTDLSWDIQFQLDTNYGLVNIGWFWARPSRKTIDYFLKSKQKWESEGGWDQAIMNKVLSDMENFRKINQSFPIPSVRKLAEKKFLNFMNTYWFGMFSPQINSQTNFYDINENIRFEMIRNASNETVIWHYTCVEKPIKIFLAKYFGQWNNLDGYYTNKRQFLRPINLGYGSNNTKILLIQFLITLKLSFLSQRTLIYPDTVIHYPVIHFPGIRTFSIDDINSIDIEYVEPTFLLNRKFKHNITIPDESKFYFSSSNETLRNLLKRFIQELNLSFKSKELIILDFSQFQLFNDLLNIENIDQWWEQYIFTNNTRNIHVNNIRLCPNINKPFVGCLKIC